MANIDGYPMIGRQQELRQSLQFVQSGWDIEVVGRRGDGRSTFLNALSEKLTERGWRVLRVYANASLSNTPLSALHLAGLVQEGGPAPVSIVSAAALLLKLAKEQNSVLLVDDLSELDELSWGVIRHVRAVTSLTIVSTGLVGGNLEGRQLLPSGGIRPALLVRLGPLTVEETHVLLQRRLGAPLAHSSLSKLYAKSGGIPELALAVVEAGLARGTFVQLEETWHLVRDSWSEVIDGVVAQHLSSLTPKEQVALKKLSLAGLIDFEDSLKLVSAENIERLEARDIVHFYPSGDRRWLTIAPPLLAEYFQQHNRHAKGNTVWSEYPKDEAPGHPTAHTVIKLPSADPLYVRLAFDHLEQRLVAAAEKWQLEPSVRSGVAYLDLLNQSRAPHWQVREVLEGTKSLVRSAEETARVDIWTVWWLAYGEEDLVSALELAVPRQEHGAYGRLLDATRVRVQLELGRTPEDAELLLSDLESLPIDVQLEMNITRALLYLNQGRFGEARELLQVPVSHQSNNLRILHDVVHGFTLLGLGDFSQTIAIAVDGYFAARDRFEATAMSAYGYLLAVVFAVSGQDQQLQTLRSTATALGGAPHFPKIAYLGILFTATIGAGRLRRQDEIRTIGEELDLTIYPEGKEVHNIGIWEPIRQIAHIGGTDSTADLLWESGQGLIERELLFSGAMSCLIAIELRPESERLETLILQLEHVRGELINAFIDYLRAVINEDTGALLSVIERLRASGCVLQAVRAHRIAARMKRDSGDFAVAEQIDGMARAFIEKFDANEFNLVQLGLDQSVLTAREKEIAHLVAEGLSNHQIAESLVLSVRTVENHVHRIIRKLGVRSRHQVAALIER